MPARIIIAKYNEGNYFSYVAGVFGNDRDMSVELKLDKGAYFIIAGIEWDELYDYVISCYSSEQIDISRVDISLLPSLLEDILCDAAIKSG